MIGGIKCGFYQGYKLWILSGIPHTGGEPYFPFIRLPAIRRGWRGSLMIFIYYLETLMACYIYLHFICVAQQKFSYSIHLYFDITGFPRYPKKGQLQNKDLPVGKRPGI